MPHHHTHQEPEQLSHPAASESMARNTHGQSLDDARAEFRTAWQAKLDGKRQQAANALGVANDLEFLAKMAAAGAAVFGALLGGALGGRSGQFFNVVLGASSGAVGGLLLALVPVGLACGCAALNRARAEELEREVRELERS